MKKLSFHKDFQLNGQSFSSTSDLIEYTVHNHALNIFLNDWFSKDQFMKVRTSGSTGEPKPIQLRKEFMINSAKATGSYFNLKSKTTALFCLPIDFIAGKMMLIRALTLGWHLDIVNPTSKPLKESKASYDFSAMVPLQALNSISELHRIKMLIIGGGEVSVTLEEKLQDIPTKTYATYGMTETITHVAVKQLNSLSSRAKSRDIYKALIGVTFSIDKRNCLIIKAPNISKEIIVTNDVVDLISETEFQWKGRYDNVINSGGIKLHPEEIEKKLSKVISQRFFVAGISDEILGEKLILVVEGSQKVSLLNEVKKLKTLDKFEVPKEIFFLKDFKETDTGKIKRQENLKSILP